MVKVQTIIFICAILFQKSAKITLLRDSNYRKTSGRYDFFGFKVSYFSFTSQLYYLSADAGKYTVEPRVCIIVNPS